MALLEFSTGTLSEMRSQDADPTVLWLQGEHDISTASTLSESIARAIALNGADLVVELSGVQFMGVVTVEALRQARERLRLVSRSLTLRSPSRPAARVLGLCDLALRPPSP